MTRLTLQFPTQRDPQCPICRNTLANGAWTLRAGVALCSPCAAQPANLTHVERLSEIIDHNAENWTTAHNVYLFTPPSYLPRNVAAWYATSDGASIFQTTPTQETQP